MNTLSFSSSDSNARSILRNWHDHYVKTKNNYWARKIEQVTGDYPDSSAYQSPTIEVEGDKVDEIEEILREIEEGTINTKIY